MKITDIEIDSCYFIFFQNALIPDATREQVVSHIVMVHQSVGEYSKLFQSKLRRTNYVTPKNYLDFINTYLRLLDEKDREIRSQVRTVRIVSYRKVGPGSGSQFMLPVKSANL